MSPAPRQKEFFARPTPTPSTVFVNDRVCVQTEEEQRVVFVHGIIFSHYPIEDRTAEAYAMVTLFETGCFSGAIRLKDSTTISPHGISGCRPLSISTLSNSELR